MMMDNVCGKGSVRTLSPQPVLVKIERNDKKEEKEEDDSLKNLKVSYQSIKHMFPKCRVKLPSLLTEPARANDNQKTDDGGEGDKCSVREEKHKSAISILKLERQVAMGNGPSDCFKKEIPKSDVCSSRRLGDIFIDVEWETEREMKNDPNVQVQEILVLRPNWIGKDCKKVMFTDLHVNLFNFEEEEKLVKDYLEKRRKQQVEESSEISSEENDVKNKVGGSCPTVPYNNADGFAETNCSPATASNMKSERRKPVETEMVNEANTRQRKHECDLCGKSFKLRALLFRHLIVHLGEKPYKCEDCGRRLRTLSKLKKHIRVHTGERPFSCSSCEKGFKQKEHLNNHVRLIHEQGRDVHKFVRKIKRRSYECTKCKEHFKQLYQLKIHVVLMHTCGGSAYSCKTCGEQFTQSASLTAHVRRGPCKKEAAEN